MKSNSYSIGSILVLMVLSAVMALNSAASAQEKKEVQVPPARDARTVTIQRILKRMTNELQLTEAQQGKIKPLLEEQSDKIAAARADEKIPAPEKGAKYKEIRDAIQARIKLLLTPEQVQKWESMSPKKD